MLIDEQTKIATLLKHHPDALETIVTLSPDFRKLRNPVLRSLMAKRTTIAMASKIGKCLPEDFFTALAPLGFQTNVAPANNEQHARPEKACGAGDSKASSPHDNMAKPDILQTILPQQLIRLDVRRMLAEGIDPLKSIQQQTKSLKPGEALVVINNFEPIPLIRLLEKQGYKVFINHIDAETIETFFYQTPADKPSNEERKIHPPVANDRSRHSSLDSGDWTDLLTRYTDKLVEIDVRTLEMPMPMMTILENLEALPPSKALYVHHKRVPVFLLTELKDRGYDYRIREVRDEEVYLLIFKN